uniref:Trafficking protein particle complex subunit 2-like protein n=1 Tax=Hucho hucho TaxID=62062 RepID=A0A4W5N714_9TELE
MAVCIAVIAKENYPLYIRSVPVQNELKFHYTVHTSLDVVEEKISAVGKAMADQRELYLGLLYPTEDYKVYPHMIRILYYTCLHVFYQIENILLYRHTRYGYVTNSKVKFVIVVDSSNTSLRDNEIRSVSQLLNLYGSLKGFQGI